VKPIQPKVLIIDDDPGVIFLHEIIVKESKLNLTPESFKDAREALEYIIFLDNAESRLLLFLDINMPKMNGWEFLDALIEKVKIADIKVVMVTSSLSKSDRDKSSNYHVVIDFWEKPMNISQSLLLQERLSDWLLK
jgi:CheY-like chemotaxis protein